jgi:beta-lactamase class A
MIHRTISLLMVLALAACTQRVTVESLKKQIEAELSLQEGVFAVAFKDLQTGEELFIHEREVFHAASTMKTPVMIEIYKQAAAGKWSLTDSVEIKNEFSSIVDGSSFSLTVDDDSEEVLYSKVGQKATLYELIYDMIIASSNLATNIVIELADAKKVTQTIRALGAADIQVLRGVQDLKAFDQGLNNTTTAYDLMVIFEQLAQGNIVSPEASDEMIKILLDQKFKEIIPAELPEGVTVAHKAGSITGVRHDSGIVFLPDGRKYVLVLLSKQMTDPEAGISSMAKVSKRIYDYVTRN